MLGKTRGIVPRERKESGRRWNRRRDTAESSRSIGQSHASTRPGQTYLLRSRGPRRERALELPLQLVLVLLRLLELLDENPVSTPIDKTPTLPPLFPRKTNKKENRNRGVARMMVRAHATMPAASCQRK